jgi:hypothetical protein
LKDKLTKLTNKHLAAFRAEAEYWLDVFHLRDWRVTYHWDDVPEDGRLFASCAENGRDRAATLFLVRKVAQEEVTAEFLCKAAFHKVCELLLADLYNLSQYNNATTDRAVHAIIRRLEHAVFRPDWERRQQGLEE